MTTDPHHRNRSKLAWVLGGLLIVILVLIAVQGIVRGGGEAVGITQAAPGDDDANPAPETVNHDQR